jgi:hypothetical protein
MQVGAVGENTDSQLALSEDKADSLLALSEGNADG